MAEILNITHEVGDFSEYTSVTNSNLVLAIDGASAMAGTGFGMSIITQPQSFNRATKTGIVLGTPATVPVWRYRFYFDPNGWTDPTNGTLRPLLFRPGSGSDCYLQFQGAFGAPETMQLVVQNDANVLQLSTKVPMPTSAVYLEIRIAGSSADTITDAFGEIYQDGVLVGGVSGFERYTLQWPPEMRVGRDAESAALGTIYVDEIVIRDDDVEIGGIGGGSDPYVAANHVAGDYVAADYQPADHS